MHQFFVIKYVSFLKLVYQNKNELPGTSMAFTVIVSRFKKSHSLLKFLVPLPWQPNLIKTLATRAISKLMIQTKEPIPTYTSSVLFTYYGHDISNMVYVSLTNYFVMVFTNCGKWLGWNIIQQLPVDSQMKTFYISIKFIVVFHVNMLQQLYLPVNSNIIGKEKKIPFKTFQPI